MPKRRSIDLLARARLAAASLCCAVAGCAVVPNDVDLGRAEIVSGTAATRFVVNGASAGRGAGAGAASGAGGGALAGAALCAATGPWFPACMIVVVSSGAGIGAGVGAGIGANVKGTAEERQAKADLLASELAAGSYASALIEHLRREARERHIDLALAGDAAAGAAASPPWRIEISLLQVATEGKERFEFQVEAGMRVLRPDGRGAAYERVFSESGDNELAMSQWTANDAEAVKREIDKIMQVLAHRMLRELAHDAQNEYIASQIKRRKQFESTR
jgi:hypothetical protein